MIWLDVNDAPPATTLWILGTGASILVAGAAMAWSVVRSVSLTTSRLEVAIARLEGEIGALRDVIHRDASREREIDESLREHQRDHERRINNLELWRAKRTAQDGDEDDE